MEQSDLLQHCVAALESLRIPYFVTGSIASAYFGEPRFTNDVDIVAAIAPMVVTPFCSKFPAPDFYVSEDAVRQAIAQSSQFNVIHPASGLKVDFMIPADTPVNERRFDRMVRIRPRADYEANFSSMEDVILSKLEFYREGGSEKHLRDIAGIIKVSGDQLDRAYLDLWAARLGVMDLLTQVFRACDAGRPPSNPAGRD